DISCRKHRIWNAASAGRATTPARPRIFVPVAGPLSLSSISTLFDTDGCGATCPMDGGACGGVGRGCRHPARAFSGPAQGGTRLIETRRLGARIGADALWVKDEGMNPTASFKARGLACAVSMCVELGIKKVAIPSAGNAASAMAAYAAAAGIEAHIFMPRDVPQSNYIECKAYGAHVTLIDGLISDCGRIVAERGPQEGWFDVSTLKEPYRIEGKKTMGYEVAEQMGWELPEAIFYPTGGGVGMIGMWKAFDEMERLGWIGSRRPKMIAVQA